MMMMMMMMMIPMMMIPMMIIIMILMGVQARELWEHKRVEIGVCMILVHPNDMYGEKKECLNTQQLV